MNRISIASLFLALPLLGACVAPIGMAAARNQPDKIRALLAAGVPVDKSGKWDWETTPLHYAAVNGSYESARVLLEAGADVNAVRRVGGTPREMALANNQTKVAELIATYEDKRNPKSASAPLPASAPPEGKAVSSDVDTPAHRGAERPDDFALVIGIEEYQSLPKADFGVRDAKTVRRHLEARGFPPRNIISLEGSQATGNKLKSYLEEWLPLNVKETSTLFVYYSGHGAPDPKTGEAYLVPWDGDASFLKSTAYPLRKFYADLSKTKAKRVLVALDACFSGAGGRSVLAQGARPLVAKVDDGAAAGARVTVLAAASGDEITGSLNVQGHGMFTYFLLKGLSEGKRTAKELHEFLSPRVQDEARRQNRQQTPMLLGDDAAF